MEHSPNWFCLRAQTRREHVAADHLRQLAGVEVFLPRIRFQRKTARGLAWFVEALFPGYLFARFDFQNQFRHVIHSNGVRGIVHFGERWPTVPASGIAELRAALGEDEMHVVDGPLAEGDEVEIAQGAFRGLKAVVTRALPSRLRVCVLLEFLGRQTTVEVPMESVLRADDPRSRKMRPA
jgi:transcriptional antiterminator RfaH